MHVDDLVLPRTPFTRQQAADLGITRRMLDELIVGRDVRRVLRGVYQRADVEDSLENRARAARLVVSPFGVYCDRTAAWLLGVDLLDFRELEIAPPLDVVVLRGKCHIERAGCRGGARDLAPYDITETYGVRHTTALRTTLDLGCALWRVEALCAMDQLMRAHGLTQAALRAALPRYRGRRGVVQLRELVPLTDPRSESTGETRLRLGIHDAGLPLPEPQHWVVHEGVPLFRLDFAYPKHRVAIEYDGQWHLATPEQRAADRTRRTWLRQHGWTVIVVRREDFTKTASQEWILRLREALRPRRVR